MRGALFENWVVTEALKARLHLGLFEASYFLRDRKGFEIDLLTDVGDRWIATEIKSGQTVAGDFFSNLEKLMKARDPAFSDRKLECRVIYGGSQSQQRRQVAVVPWSDVRNLAWW